MRALSSILVLISVFALALGISQPLLTFERLFFLTENPSLFGIVGGLAGDGDVLLAVVVALISIVFPAIKLVGLQTLIVIGPRNAPQLQRALAYLSKWSMMDVVLVAIVIFAAKTSGLAAAFTQPGIWFYATSAVLGAIAAKLPLPDDDPTSESETD